ncbi:MAG TPA: hypothetical protein VGW58_17405 [Pyrinomonadaceae bacterium]|nr:hypothetical protein [Pyrinomonadaceae bacterium]
MQGIVDAIKYLYQQFILRDVVAYVTPGTILTTCLLRVHFRGLEPALLFIERIPKIAYVPIYGLLFTMGLGIQNFGEMIRLLKDHVRKDQKGHLSEKLRFGKLQDFHRVLSRQTPDRSNDYAEWMERTRERIEVKKYASGNIALALVMGAVVILVAKLSWNAGRWAIVATGVILAVSLIRANYLQAENARIWEDGAIDYHKRELEESHQTNKREASPAR